MAEHGQPPAEFSRIVPLDQLDESGSECEIAANEAERAALAKRFGLLELGSLEARLSLRRERGSPLIKLAGRLTADLVQACVVSLEPVPERVEESFELLFTLEPAPETAEVHVEAEDEDIPEPVGPGGIDLGEAVAQQLSLAMNPYPRAEGASLERAEWGAEGGPQSPFAVLERLKRES